MLLAVLVCVLALVVVLFYGMQKYAIITKDEVKIDTALLGGKESSNENILAEEKVVYDTVNANVVVKEPDFDSIEATAGKGLEQVRAVFIPSDQINKTKVEESVSRLSTGNSIVIEMKPRSGNLMWHSMSSVANNYSLNYDTEVTANIQSYVDYIKEHSVWLVAQISCCVDNRLASYSTGIALKTAAGTDYYDETGTWLDPYNSVLRSYIVDMCEELYAMGFDEVVLADIAHPSLEEGKEVAYTMDMSQSPSTQSAVCGLAMYVADQLEKRSGVLSIYANTAYSLVKTDNATGQSVPIFLKKYDRIYYVTDKYTYTFNLQDMERSLSEKEASFRFVPVVTNYLPSDPATISWVLIDKEEDTN